MDNRDRESTRRRRCASSPDLKSLSNVVGLGLGFRIQSNTNESNNTMDGAQCQHQPVVYQANESVPTAAAPPSVACSAFSSMGPRPPSGLISAAATRGMFGRNISAEPPALARRSNSHLSSGSFSTAMDRVQSHSQAGTRRSRISAPKRSKASSTKASSTTTPNRPVGSSTTTDISDVNAPTGLPFAPAMSHPFATSFPAATLVTSSGSYAPIGATTEMGMSGANTSSGLSSATSANNPPLSAAAFQSISNRSNTTSTNSQPNMSQFDTMLNNISPAQLHNSSNFLTVISQLSATSIQLGQQLNIAYNVLSTSSMHNPQDDTESNGQIQGPRATADTVAATTFHRFPKIPKELQLKVWKLLIPGPRIIEVKRETITTTFGEDESSEITYERCVSQASHPVLLHVCHDSRYLAKRIYKICLEAELKWPVYMDPNNDILLFPDNDALDVFALSVPRADCSTPPSLAHIKTIIIDIKGVVSPLQARPEPSPENRYPAYRLEEIAAMYGSLRGIIVLKYPDNHHRAPLPPQLNQAGMLGGDGRAVVRNHLRRLLQWGATMRRNGQQGPRGIAVNVPGPGALPHPNQVHAATGAGSLGGGWLQGLLHAAGGYGQGPAMANGGNAGMNPFLNPHLPARIPWSLPKIVAMTLEELTERMEHGEPEEENDTA